jgi:hypothetical protein
VRPDAGVQLTQGDSILAFLLLYLLPERNEKRKKESRSLISIASFA